MQQGEEEEGRTGAGVQNPSPLYLQQSIVREQSCWLSVGRVVERSGIGEGQSKGSCCTGTHSANRADAVASGWAAGLGVVVSGRLVVH